MTFILEVFVWVLALYGLLEIVKDLINISKINDIEKKGIKHLMFVKNQEENIEGYLRTYLLKRVVDNKIYNDDVLVIDLESTDNTKKILKKLEEETNEIKCISIEQVDELINKFKYNV